MGYLENLMRERADREWEAAQEFKNDHGHNVPWPPTCDKCGGPIDIPGAVLLSPPKAFKGFPRASWVGKYHICCDCWYSKLIQWIRGDD